MARKPLSEEEKQARIKQREEDHAKYVRPYAKKSSTIEPAAETQTTIAEPTPIMETAQVEGGDQSAIKTADQPSFNPMAGKRIQRSYSNPTVDARLAALDIPEQDLGSGTNAAVEDILRDRETQPGIKDAEGKKTTPPPVNQMAQQLGTENLSLAETKQNAEEAVAIALGAYGELWQLGASFVAVKEEKLIKLHQEGKFDLHGVFISPKDDPRGNGLTNREFVLDMNKQVAKAVQTSPEFITQITPPLTRLAQKYKIGISDEGKVAILLGKDMFKKSMMLFQMSKLVTGAVEAMQKNSAASIDSIIENRTLDIANQASSAISSIQAQQAQMQAEYEKKIQDLQSQISQPHQGGGNGGAGMGQGQIVNLNTDEGHGGGQGIALKVHNPSEKEGD